MNDNVSMSRTVLAASLTVAMSAPAISHAAGMAFVTNGHDAGPGSLRHAIEESGKHRIRVVNHVSTINLTKTLNYAGVSPLIIEGSGQMVTAAGNFTLLAATQGADLMVSNLHFKGPGGYSIKERGDTGQSAGKGIFVDVRDDQTGIVKLVLKHVSVSGVANHGIHVSDCSLADDCGSGSGGGGNGSAASIKVLLKGVKVDDVGNGKFDADGLRVDERGDGDIHATIIKSSFTRVGADGVELDEGNNGSVNAITRLSYFGDNGNYCNPDILKAFLPNPDEDEFDQGDMVTEDMIPGDIVGSPDDSCFEREVDIYDPDPVTGIEYVEAYEFGIDLDDGFDIDEAGEGSLNLIMARSIITGNRDEGADLDEEDAGDIFAAYHANRASGNTDDAYKHSETGSGDVTAYVLYSSATDNGGKGFSFEEEVDKEGEGGDLAVTVLASQTANNDDGDEAGIEVVEEGVGSCNLKVSFSDIADGIDDKDCE